MTLTLPLEIKLAFAPGLNWKVEVYRADPLRGDPLRGALGSLGFQFGGVPRCWFTLVTADQLPPTLEQVLRLCSAQQVQVSADSTPLLQDPRPAHDLATGETLLNLNESNILPASTLPVGTLEGQLVQAVASRPFEHFRTRHFVGDLAHWIARDFWTAWDFVYRLTSAYALKLTTADSADFQNPQSIRHLITVCRARHPEFTPERLRGLRVTDGQRFFLQPFFVGLEELGLLEN